MSITPHLVGDALIQIIPNPESVTGDPGLGPIAAQEIAIARGRAPANFRDATYRHKRYRVYSSRLQAAADTLIRTAKPLAQTQATLNRLVAILIGLTLGVGAAAALFGRIAADAVVDLPTAGRRSRRHTYQVPVHHSGIGTCNCQSIPGGSRSWPAGALGLDQCDAQQLPANMWPGEWFQGPDGGEGSGEHQVQVVGQDVADPAPVLVAVQQPVGRPGRAVHHTRR